MEIIISKQMKKLIFMSMLFISTAILSQETPKDYSKTFDEELSVWKLSFKNFNLNNFQLIDEVDVMKDGFIVKGNFDKLEPIYREIGYFSPNKTKFVDVNSYLSLSKSGGVYIANPDVDQNVELYVLDNNQKIRIFSCGSSIGIDDVCWVTENQLILAGTIYGEVKSPLVLILNLKNGKLYRFENSDANCVLSKKYQSAKLKSVRIK